MPEPERPGCDAPKKQSVGDREEPEHRQEQQTETTLEVPGGFVVTKGEVEPRGEPRADDGEESIDESQQGRNDAEGDGALVPVDGDAKRCQEGDVV